MVVEIRIISWPCKRIST